VLLAVPEVAHCQDAEEKPPVFTHLNPGETADFSGYLLSPEAVGTVISVDEERRRKEAAAATLKCAEERADLTRQIKESGARITRLEGELSIERDGRKSDAEIYKREITRLKGRALVYGAAGFAAGAIAAGIVALATP
jgi:hypothetical protein